jgi:iron complex transport system substrate-binding protein
MHLTGRLRGRILAALLLATLVLPGSAWAAKVTDDLGRVVEFASTPRRIVSLLPSLTETVCALDHCQSLVGVDRYSNYPASVRALATVGDGLAPSLEAILALHPDVVLMAASSRATQRLQALGLRVLILEPKNHADLRRVCEQLGLMLGVTDVGRLWADIDAGVDAAARSVPPGARGAKVYFEANSGPYAAGESSFIGETLTRLGVKNIVPASMGPFPLLSPEFVVRGEPDFILVGDIYSTGLESRPGWSSLRAVRERHICRFSAEDADVLVRPGPRMALAARVMARCLGAP